MEMERNEQNTELFVRRWLVGNRSKDARMPRAKAKAKFKANANANAKANAKLPTRCRCQLAKKIQIGGGVHQRLIDTLAVINGLFWKVSNQNA